MDEDLRRALDGVPARLRALREARGWSLAELSATTGVSVSTLSRLETGDRRPALEHLLPLARAHRLPLHELVDAPQTGDPRVHARPRTAHGSVVVPLSTRPGGLQAYKVLLPVRAAPEGGEVEQRVHEGYDWLYVLSGRVRLLLGEHDLLLGPGEVAEFDTRTPHWSTSAGPGPAEVLALFGASGARVHVRARPRR